MVVRRRRFDGVVAALVMTPGRRGLDRPAVVVPMMSSRRGGDLGRLHRMAMMMVMASRGQRRLGHLRDVMMMVMNGCGDRSLRSERHRRQGEGGHKGNLDGVSHKSHSVHGKGHHARATRP